MMKTHWVWLILALTLLIPTVLAVGGGAGGYYNRTEYVVVAVGGGGGAGSIYYPAENYTPYPGYTGDVQNFTVTNTSHIYMAVNQTSGERNYTQAVPNPHAVSNVTNVFTEEVATVFQTPLFMILGLGVIILMAGGLFRMRTFPLLLIWGCLVMFNAFGFFGADSILPQIMPIIILATILYTIIQYLHCGPGGDTHGDPRKEPEHKPQTTIQTAPQPVIELPTTQVIELKETQPQQSRWDSLK